MNLNKLKQVFFTVGLGICILFILGACESEKDRIRKAVEEAEAIVAQDKKGWFEEDSDLTISTLSEDFVGYDALSPGWSYDYELSLKMSQDKNYWDSIEVSDGSSFVSSDGRFAAISTKFNFLKTQVGAVPNLHLMAFDEGKIIYAFDYYGLITSQTEPIPFIEPRQLEPGSDEAMKQVEQTETLVQKWQKAYNERNLEDYLACYSESMKSVTFEKPDWRVVRIDDFTQETMADFSRSEFLSRLVAPTTSPIPNGVFVSADGHYAVAQGTFEDKGTVASRPMAILIEIVDSKIVRQYTYRR